MKTTFVSSQAVANATRLSTIKMQADVAKHSQELSSGRWADVGLKLGHRTGHSLEMRQEIGRIETILDTNGMVASRLHTTQAALDGIRQTAERTLATLVTLRNNPGAAAVAGPVAALDLKALAGALNANLNGQHIFAGINTDVKPFADYEAAPSPAKAAVDAAFVARFGVAQTDPGVANISEADMALFLENDFAALFEDPAWSAWSQASGTRNLQSRISTSELVETSVNTNEPAFRKLAMAYTMLSDLGGAKLPSGVYQAVVRKATEVVGAAVPELTTLQGRLGVAQNRVKDADQRLAIQRDILTKQVSGLEAVDPYDTAARLNELMSQVEMSYSITARVRQLSLLKFI